MEREEIVRDTAKLAAIEKQIIQFLLTGLSEEHSKVKFSYNYLSIPSTSQTEDARIDNFNQDLENNIQRYQPVK